jgi:hypothetical protein
VDIETMKPAINNWVSSFFLNEVACEVGVTDFDKVVAYAVFLVPLSLHNYTLGGHN